MLPDNSGTQPANIPEHVRDAADRAYEDSMESRHAAADTHAAMRAALAAGLDALMTDDLVRVPVRGAYYEAVPSAVVAAVLSKSRENH